MDISSASGLNVQGFGNGSVINANVTCVGPINFTNKNLGGEGTMTINGNLFTVPSGNYSYWYQKNLTVNGTITVDGGPGSYIGGISPGMHNYNGDISVTNGGTLFLESGMVINDDINITTDSRLNLKYNRGSRTIGTGATITNNGQFNASAGADVTINCPVTGNGQIFIESTNSSRMIFNNGISANHKLILEGRAEFNNVAATIKDFDFGGVLSGNAPVQVSNTAFWRDGGPTTGPNYSGSAGLTFMNTCTLTVSGGHKQNYGAITINGPITGSFPPSIVGDGSVTVNTPTFFTSDADREIMNQDVTYNATHTKTGSGSNTYGGSNGSLTNNSVMFQNSTGTIFVGNNFVNNDTLKVTQNKYQQTAGSFTNNAGKFIKGAALADLSGASSVNNNGTMAPGLSPGILTVTRAAGVPVNHLQIEVASNAGPGTGHDQLVVNGPATLSGGTLTVTRLNGFVPSNGSSYIIMTYSSRTGSFGSVTPSCWTINYGATSATITFNAGTLLYADNDHDGYGNSSVSAPACDAPSGYVTQGGDCNDNSNAVYPGAYELCDGLDNDCNGQIDGGSDKTALLALYNATNGANWFSNFGWADGAAGTNCNVCEWSGVTCDENGRVVDIYMYDNNLVGSIPVAIGNLNQLQSLNLGYNQLSGSIPASIGNLSQLSYLDMRYNQLSGNIPASLGGLSNLTYIDLGDNQLSGAIPTELGNLTNLNILALNHNQLSNSIPTTLGNLSNLNYLFLQANQLSGNIPASLGNLSNLYSMALGGNLLTGNIPSELGNLSNLYELYLNENQLSGNIPAALGNLTNLQIVFLNNNQLSGSIPGSIGNLPLSSIYFNNNNLSGCFDPNLSNLCGISYDFSNNPNLHLNGDFLAFCEDGAGGCGIDADGDGFSFPDDCNDRDNTIHPNATEICNGIDDDCDGTIDEGAAAPAQITGTLGFCTGGSTVLTASGGTSYTWSTGATTASITVSTSGTYTVTVDNGNGCPGTAAATVAELPLPNATISGTLTFCPGSSTVLTASGGSNYAWSTGVTTVGITVSSAGTYTVTVTGANGCTKTATATVTQLPLPNAGISGVLSFCIPGSTTLTGTGGGSYSWSTRATSPSITVSAAGTYTVTATGANGCTATATATVTANTPPVTLIGGNTIFCAGSTNTLTASGGNTYIWNTGATTASITVNTTGTYTVTATGAGGCTGTAAATVLELPLPNASISGALTFCPGSSTVLTASGGSNYAWSTGATTAGITASSAGTYTVTVTDANGCTKTATATVTQLPLPNAGISGVLSFCAPGSTTLTGTGGASYTWSTGASTTSITVNTAGAYTVTATGANGCTASATANVTSNTSLSPVINGNTSFCAGGSTILTASGGNTYNWNTGATTAAITVTASGTYTVTATGTGGCTGTASVAVSQLPLPTPSISGSLTFCAGSSTVLTASGGNTYTWSTSATTAATTVNTAGTYTVTATGANGCTATATATVTQLALSNASISGTLTFCAGGNTILTAAGGGTYAWNTGATTAGITVSSAGTYTVVVTGGNGCTKTATATVSELPLPTASISGTLTFCTGGSTILTASGGGTYVWNTGATTAGITVSSAGTYTVVVTGGNGCTKTATATVSALPLPTASISGTLTFCTGGSTILTASGGGTYVWSTAATTAGITVSSAGTYTVTVTGANGCTKTATATVTQLALPTPSISGTLSFCAGGSTALTASGGNTYNWSTGATTAATTVSAPGTYTVTATGANGCTASTTATVTQLALPTPGISGTLNFCAGNSTVLTATGGTSYVWSTGATTTSIPVNAGGAYTVTATAANGCTATATAAVAQLPLPVPSISGVTNVCAGSNTVLTAAGGNTYSWSTGATTASVTVNAAATYTVTATGANGCTATATATVVFNTPPNAQITGNTTICAGGIATLTATGGVLYSWSTGATTAAINTNVAGAYTVTATGANGCTATVSATVTVSNLPFAVSVLGNLAFCTGSSTTLTASGGASYVWSTGSSTASITVNAGGLFTVTATNIFGCTATATATVLVKPLPTPLIVASPNACSGSSTVLTASGGTSYTWSTGATANSIAPLSAGTYTVTATNQGGCTATATAHVQASPNITCPSSQTVCAGSTTSLSGSPVGGTYSGAGVSGSTFNAAAAGMGTHIITYTVTGAGGCTASCTFTMTVVPGPDAGITAASPVAANSTGNSASVANAGIGATYSWGIVNGTITSGNGTDAITYTAGASGTVSLSVGVGVGTCTATSNRSVTIGDGPAMVCPTSRIVGTDLNTCSANLSLTHPMVTGPNPPLTLSVAFGNGSPAPSSLPTGGTVTAGGTTNYVFQSGQTQVTYTAMNGLGQTATCILNIAVRDQQAPVLTCPLNIVRGTDAGQCTAVVSYATPSVTDNCGAASASLLSGPASGAVFPIGTTTVVWRAGDASGNLATCSFTVTVQDNQPPAITCPPNQNLFTHPGRCEAYALYNAPTASDNCGIPALTRISGSESGGPFPKGIHTIVWQARDATGNTRTCSFRIIVSDNEVPIITCPTDFSVNTDFGVCTAVVTYPMATFTDNCPGGSVVRIGGLSSGSNFPVGLTQISFRATDAGGRSSTCTLRVTVVDNQPPVITCPGSVIVTGSGMPCNAQVFYSTPTITDNCPANLTLFLLTGLMSGSSFPAGVTTNVWRCTDGNGLIAECAFTVTVNCPGTAPRPGGQGMGKMTARQAATLHLAPNPATFGTTLTAEGLGEQGGELLMFDAMGRLVFQHPVLPDEATVYLDLGDSAFAPGTYRVVLRTEKEVVCKALVVVK